MNGQVIVDTSVLVRIFDQAEESHDDAARLGIFFIENDITVRFPFHALWEVSATLKRKNLDKNLVPFKGISESNALRIDPVPIDEGFFTKYFREDLPYAKAGDLLFIAMAIVDSIPLITEDIQQYKVAKSVGVTVYNAGEYLSQMAV